MLDENTTDTANAADKETQPIASASNATTSETPTSTAADTTTAQAQTTTLATPEVPAEVKAKFQEQVRIGNHEGALHYITEEIHKLWIELLAIA